ncbi:MAG: Do family serine endopeptidase [Phycisphaerae bacterium]|nr:Do family serine endopeptidase [Phycisphaerae bacterium]
MVAMHRRRWPLLVGLFVTAVLAYAFHSEVVGRLAYAVEKGKIQASSEELAKVEALSSVFRLVAKTARPSVVQIETVGPVRRPSTEELPDVLRRFLEQHRGIEVPEPEPDPEPERGTGSGVIIDAENGYVVTNNHVVQNAEKIEVRLSDRRRLEAKLLGTDPKTDLAVIQIKADRLHAAPLGDSDTMEVGDWVLAIGAPFGLDQTVSQGIISAVGRSNIGLNLDYQDFIQTDAAINPGNSGGPLVNMRGEVIGINTAIKRNPLLAGFVGIGFAIPSKMVKQYLPDLIAGREIERGYLGVRIQSLREQPGLAKTFGLQEDTGVLIEDILAGGPAAKAGLKVEDIILEYNGEPVRDNTDVSSRVAVTKPGTVVTMKVWRQDKAIDVEVTIGKQPEGFSTRGYLDSEAGAEETDEAAEIEPLGMTVARLTPELIRKYRWDEQAAGAEDLKGVIVVKVDPYGEAASLQIRPGELIVSIQGKPVNTPRDVVDAVDADALKEGIRMRVRSVQGSRWLLLQAD